MKQTLGLCVKNRGGGGKPSNKRELQYLCFYIYVYVCTGQIYPFIFLFFFSFKTHSTKRKSHWQKKETDNTNLSIHTLLINRKINKIWEREQNIATYNVWGGNGAGNTLAHTRWCKCTPTSLVKADTAIPHRSCQGKRKQPPSPMGKRGKGKK